MCYTVLRDSTLDPQQTTKYDNRPYFDQEDVWNMGQYPHRVVIEGKQPWYQSQVEMINFENLHNWESCKSWKWSWGWISITGKDAACLSCHRANHYCLIQKEQLSSEKRICHWMAQNKENQTCRKCWLYNTQDLYFHWKSESSIVISFSSAKRTSVR